MANYIYTGSWKSSPEKDDAGIQLYRQNPQNGTLDAVEKYMQVISVYQRMENIYTLWMR